MRLAACRIGLCVLVSENGCMGRCGACVTVYALRMGLRALWGLCGRCGALVRDNGIDKEKRPFRGAVGLMRRAF